MARPEPNIFSQKCGKGCVAALTSISTLCEVCERTDGPATTAITANSATRIRSLRIGRIKLAPPRVQTEKGRASIAAHLSSSTKAQMAPETQSRGYSNQMD